MLRVVVEEDAQESHSVLSRAPSDDHARELYGTVDQEAVEARQVCSCVVTGEVPDAVAVDLNHHGLAILRVIRLGHKYRADRGAHMLGSSAANQLPECVLVERLADHLKRLVAGIEPRLRP